MKRASLALILTCLASSADAQSTSAVRAADSLRAIIRGAVRDSLGIPVEGASVLLSPGGLILRTDSAGRFSVRNVPQGSVTLTVRRLGFSPVQTRITPAVGVELSLDLVMKRLPQVLAEVEIRADPNRQCARYSLEGILCRREVGRGHFMNRQDIVATNAIHPQLVLRDVPGLRQNLNGDGRGIESTVGWRCIAFIVDGRAPSNIDPIPRVRDMFAVEVYQPDVVPPEYKRWSWRGAYPCTLIAFWSMRVGRQATRNPR